MNIQEAIERGKYNVSNNIKVIEDTVLTDWISSSTPEDYELFADAIQDHLCENEFDVSEDLIDSPEEAAGKLNKIHKSIKRKEQKNPGTISFSPARRKYFWPVAASVLVCLTGLYIWMDQKNTPDQKANPGLAAGIKTSIQTPVLKVNQDTIGFSLPVSVAEIMTDTEFANISLPDTSGKNMFHQPAMLFGDDLESGYQTIASPPGKRLNIHLPDGSRVWLNAGSVLHYPMIYGAYERKVTLTGEAFFEVAKNADKPFIVKAGSAAIKVMGTRFNVNCYANAGDIRITLLDGAIAVNARDFNRVLVPGQQAVLGRIYAYYQNEDIAYASAWMRGIFDFRRAGLYQIMMELERWYGIKAYFDGPQPPGEYTFQASRELKLENVLALFEKSGVHFSLNRGVLWLNK